VEDGHAGCPSATRRSAQLAVALQIRLFLIYCVGLDCVPLEIISGYGCLTVAVVAHPIFLISHGVFCIHPAHGRVFCFGTRMDLGASLTSLSERPPSCVHFMRMV
jgi:hypothetical protein